MNKNFIKQLKPFDVDGFTFPISDKTRIITNKFGEYLAIYQQFTYFGEVGDKKAYISGEKLQQLKADGCIELETLN